MKRHEAAEKGFELNTWAEKGQYVVAKGRKKRKREGGAENRANKKKKKLKQ